MKWNNLKEGYKSNLEIERRKTPHEILGVEDGVDSSVLRKSYISKVKAYHPDSSDSFMREYNQEMLKIINLAYSTIREKTKNVIK